MVQYYQIFGSKVGSHYLAIGVLTTLFGGISLLSGGKKAAASDLPPINAASKDEENFVTQFLKEAEAKDAKAKH
ncbi:hypothetical protein AMS68_006390 [Peltaster fructicola]|uniref:ATP synthase subunit K, mitochondrial n=1 Tax=Peltaster fructicola TaxID=286661 RepID=A0A6H0Y1J4_9PEZI|nr:hypothetical protein AMS68_006390 [Peltaster fructicola]